MVVVTSMVDRMKKNGIMEKKMREKEMIGAMVMMKMALKKIRKCLRYERLRQLENIYLFVLLR